MSTKWVMAFSAHQNDWLEGVKCCYSRVVNEAGGDVKGEISGQLVCAAVESVEC